MRGATLVDARDDVLALISTRAPLAGSDTPSSTASRSRFDFNPRSPCGERRRPPWFRRPTVCYFNPRSPCGERRPLGQRLPRGRVISIRAPLAGSDRCPCPPPGRPPQYFNPRSPCGERRACQSQTLSVKSISIRAPLAGSDIGSSKPSATASAISIRAPLAGSDRCSGTMPKNTNQFQSALPLRGATREYGNYSS